MESAEKHIIKFTVFQGQHDTRTPYLAENTKMKKNVIKSQNVTKSHKKQKSQKCVKCSNWYVIFVLKSRKKTKSHKKLYKIIKKSRKSQRFDF